MTAARRLTPEDHAAITRAVVDEMESRAADLRHAIDDARYALVEADGALCAALAALGIPSRPASVSPLPRRTRRSS